MLIIFSVFLFKYSQEACQSRKRVKGLPTRSCHLAGSPLSYLSIFPLFLLPALLLLYQQYGYVLQHGHREQNNGQPDGLQTACKQDE